MEPGEFIENFVDKKGKQITIRAIDLTDVNDLMHNINELIEEDAFLMVNEKQSYLDEINFVTDKIQGLINGDIAIVGVADGKVVAEADITRHRWRENTIGEFGIAIIKDYRNSGLGQELMKVILERAKKENYRIIKLGVFEGNSSAKHLYEKMGFKVMGVLPKSALFKGKYIDEI
ncbi:MAG: GNAT family N-acetyltransferase, partial [Candidatus Micrarchaeia archaeon]